MNGRLHPDDVEAIACRVVELQARTLAAPTRGLVDANTLARAIGMSRSHVYEHAAEYGAVQIGDGSRPRLRFNLDVALAAHSRRLDRPEPPERPARQAPKRPRPTAAVPLLPIRGERAA